MFFAIAAIVVVLCALAYRLRGSGLIGTFGGRLAWSTAVILSFLLLGAPFVVAATAGALAFAGMWFSHSKVYRINNAQDASAMCAVHLARMCLVTLLTPTVLVIPAALLATAAHALARHLEDKRISTDMLRTAEPMVGAVYGLLFAATIVLEGFQ